MYLCAEQDAVPVLEQFLFNDINNKQFQQMVDLTRFAAAAVYIAPDGETGDTVSRYRLAAWGSYPASRAKVALGSSREWKKRRSAVSGENYWYSRQGGYSVAITGGMAFAATAAKGALEPPDPFSASPGTALPENFAVFREGSILSFWLADPGSIINQKLSSLGIPLEIPAQRLFAGLFPLDGQLLADNQNSSGNRQYTARLQMQTAGENQARALAVMINLARNFLPPPSDPDNPAALLSSLLFSHPPELDGSNLVFSSSPLSGREIALLFRIFSL